MKAAAEGLRRSLVAKDELIDALADAAHGILTAVPGARPVRALYVAGPSGVGVSHTIRRFSEEALGDSALYERLSGGGLAREDETTFFGHHPALQLALEGTGVAIAGILPTLVSRWSGRLGVLQIDRPSRFPFAAQLTEALGRGRLTRGLGTAMAETQEGYDVGRLILVLRGYDPADERAFPDLAKTVVRVEVTPALRRELLDGALSGERPYTVRVQPRLIERLVHFGNATDLDPTQWQVLGGHVVVEMIETRRLDVRAGDTVDLELSSAAPGGRVFARIAATGEATAAPLSEILGEFVHGYVDLRMHAEWARIKREF